MDTIAINNALAFAHEPHFYLTPENLKAVQCDSLESARDEATAVGDRYKNKVESAARILGVQAADFGLEDFTNIARRTLTLPPIDFNQFCGLLGVLLRRAALRDEIQGSILRSINTCFEPVAWTQLVWLAPEADAAVAFWNRTAGPEALSALELEAAGFAALQPVANTKGMQHRLALRAKPQWKIFQFEGTAITVDQLTALTGAILTIWRPTCSPTYFD